MEERLFDTQQQRPSPRADARAARAAPDGHGARRPLAVRVRPRTLEQFVGQSHLLGEGASLRTAIEQGNPHSMVLYGPPGSGKTTLARMLAERAPGVLEEYSAVAAGRAEVREVIERATHRRAEGIQTIFFLDEIHRFNKAQQDALLPAVEEGLVILIGATTENPYFEVNSALLSRSQIYELRPLAHEQVAELLRRAITDPERGIANPPPVGDEVIEFLSVRAGGDARAAYTALGLAAETAPALQRPVTVELAEDAMQKKAVLYD